MGFGLFLVPVLAGYWLLTRLHYTRYRSVRGLGYHVLFQSAIAGGFLFSISFFITTFVLNPYLPQAGERWQMYVAAPYSDAVALSVLLGLMLPVIVNPFYGAEKASRVAAKRSGWLIESLIAESVESGQLIEVSLKSRKVYIGLALQSGIRMQGEPDVSLVPLASGYRHTDTQELRITTNYARVIRDLINESGNWDDASFNDLSNNLRIVIPMSEIVSARLFDWEVYQRFEEAARRIRETADGPSE